MMEESYLAIALVMVATVFVGFLAVSDMTGGAIKISCADSDGGLNYDVAGAVTYRGRLYNDACTRGTRLKEYYCKNERLGLIYKTCRCKSGACVSVSQTPNCTAGYLSSYQCSGNWSQRKYSYSNCTIQWVNYQYCSYGCSNGGCLANQTRNCTAGYLDAYQCSGSWRQKQYVNSDCSTTWKDYQYCNNGCSNGVCLSAPQNQTNQTNQTCPVGYLNSYQCSGNWRQRLYRNSNCTTKWVNYQYCSYSCLNGTCQSAPQNQTTQQTGNSTW